ncbi:circularly permuted type 2 ATP-grasp protein [Fulvivirga lutimaris]|uniref:circularly permuted type 2 ATP-grasp protein n=1 Tax=Fulvivirga lutimaris TaxID=1819566 RepID=UPI0012BD42BE|nr:circularly permuted type 2 ATP-grasp protein [Fulvivirga lutimaris]MTI38927.1 circularly permuted type 2 ATP-grasp protein [Fulvivirga lutimaris]
MFDENGDCRSTYEQMRKKLNGLSDKKLFQLQHSTEKAQISMGMTFNVYHDSKGVEKILHLDLVPRIISAQEWQVIEEGLQQRIKAVNLFLDDIYNDQKIFKDKVIPSEVVLSSSDYLKPCIGLKPPKGIWSHISGSDIVRDQNGKFYVLEDNLRCPSGVSYLLENREIIKQAFPELFSSLGVRPVSEYPSMLLNMLQYMSEESNPTVAVLTPGIYNSAYFEHSYLAQQMGVELVTGPDLMVKNKRVYMQTTKGLEPVHALYRRIDDTFMDPTVFNPDSMLGVPGLFEAYKAGNIVIANAPGTGVADDKAVYTYMPKIIKYYLNEDPIIENVPTYMCSEKDDLAYVLENIEELVVKETNAAGGYGMLIGPKADKEEHEKFRKLLRANPRNYIAQPTLSLSTVPTLSNEGFAPRHVDLRPYVVYGEKIDVLPGALTRVALVKDSLVVNSSQGGGSKDTWVLFE